MDSFHFIYIYIVVIFIYINSLQETSAHGKRWLTVDKRQTTGRSSSRTREMYHEHELRTASPRGGWVESDRIGWRWVVGGGRWSVVSGCWEKDPIPAWNSDSVFSLQQGSFGSEAFECASSLRFPRSACVCLCVCVWVRRCECVATKVSQMTLVCRDGVSNDFYYISYLM